MGRTFWIALDALLIEDSLSPTEWIFTINARLPDESIHPLAVGIVPVKMNVPVGSLEFVLDKVTLGGDRVQLGTAAAQTSLTGFAIDRALDLYAQRFGSEPDMLGGSLISDNKRYFQVAYLR